MKKNSVLCAIDVNDYDQDIVDLAAHFAKQFGTDLDLLHVTLTPDPSNAAWPAYIGAPSELVRDNRTLKRVETNVDGVEVHGHQLAGLPVDKVVKFVEQNKPRLLVLGTHARTGFERLLGSISSKIMRRVACPVMLAKQKRNSHEQNATETA